ncbi:hypothetical protein T484DRAFT_1955824, partial [Baffinella frigidus]
MSTGRHRKVPHARRGRWQMIARKDTRGSSSACTRGSRACTQQNLQREQGGDAAWREVGALGRSLSGSAPSRGAVPESSGLSTFAPRTRCRPPSTDVPHRDARSEPKIAGI